MSRRSLAQNILTGTVPPLPFSQYAGECYFDSLDDGDRTNHFKCPLPSAAVKDCKFRGGPGVHCT
jgi:hypothetical protein